ncbi:Exonuclease V, mitochondrial [Candida tropicalis]
MVISKNEETRPMLKNEQLMNIYKHWNLYHKNDLPFINPTKYTPFEFQSIENDDISYINNPRLSVTKLLISGWCELRELYRVFAGSVRTPPTKAMSAGTKLHLKLEQALHGVIDLEDIENFIRSNTEEIMEMYDLVDNDGIFDMNPDDSIAIDWSETIIERLYSLIVCSESREVILHGYLNLQKESFVENEQEIKNPSSVLVSGIVDQIQFENPENSDDFALFDEVQKYLDVEYEQVDETPLVDLSRFFDDVKNIIQCYPEFQLKFTDLKTRMVYQIPSQKIVSDYEFGKLFVLSKDFAQHQEQASQHLKFIESLGGYDSLEYDKLLLPLLKTWKTPPTLRYLAARSAQFYEIFGSRLGDTTTVEYRNTFTGKIIDTKVYNYNNDELETETIHASDFWNGKLDPEPTNDFSRCQYCEFKSKCAIPKIGKISDSHASIGPEVRKFLNDVKHLQKDC